jgi:hypothetical protein
MREEPKVLVKDAMAIAEPASQQVAHTKAKEAVGTGEHHETLSSLVAVKDQSLTHHTSPSSVPRIEDSVEALDRLEEELEALDAAVQIGTTLPSGVLNRTRAVGHVARSPNPTLNRTTSTKKAARPVVTNARVNLSESRPTARVRASTIPDKEDVVGSEERAANKAGPRRSTVSRPASLLPPKPPAKSSKPPTRPTFELPGEAVARRLKEQREARLSMQISPDKAAQLANAIAASPRPKSTKVPTVPNFELPGEVISRRKREEREAKLKAKEEEERRRREFKARPVRASIVPNTLPRETIASRARQAKAAQEEYAPRQSEAPPASKRVSLMVGRTTTSTSATNKSTETRGREIGSSSTQISRATSTSTSSLSGKRSTLSAEETHQQKLRGKEIYKQDNCLTEDRDRERKERENAAKLAREQAAERSRQTSRDWAEKQRLKKLAALAQNAVEHAVTSG